MSFIKRLMQGIGRMLSPRNGDAARKAMSALMVLLAIIVESVLLLQYGRGEVSTRYFVLYSVLGGFAVIHGAITFVIDWGLKNTKRTPDNPLAQALFLFEENPLRIASRVWFLPLALFLVLSGLLFIITSASGFSFYGIGDPYQQGVALNEVSLSQHGYAKNLFFTAVVPGLFEEWTVLAGIEAMTFFLLLGLSVRRTTQGLVKSGGAYWPVAVLSTVVVTAVYAALFAYAHGRYEGSQPAFVYAFLFEFSVQMLNQLTGSFLSWMPHMAHNAGIVTQQTLSFTFAAVVPPVIPFIPRRWRQ